MNAPPERVALLERYGAVYGELHLAIAFTESLAGPGAKRCREAKWQKTEPLATGPFGAGLLKGRGKEHNPALVLRPSGLIGVECDTPEGLEQLLALGLPKTVTVQSSEPHKLHFWFRPPAANPEYTAFRFEVAGVTADRGRYLLVPPAVHPSGRVYTFLRSPEDTEIATLPQATYDELVRLAAHDGIGRRQVDDFPGAPIAEGARNDTLTRMAGAMRRRGMVEASIAAALLEENARRCRPPLSENEVRGIAASVAGYPPAERPAAEPVPGPEPAKPAWEPLPIREAAEGEPRREANRFSGLVYGSGAITLVSSEPGVGKTMLLAALAAEEAIAERNPLLVDFEGGGPAMMLERFQDAGLSDEHLDRILYVRPRAQATPAELRALVERLCPSLVTLDSFDAGLAAHGLETKNEDVRAFQAQVLEPLRSTGAPLVIADHVTKDRERRGRFTIGGQAKLGLCDAHLGVTAIVQLRRGSGGKLKVAVHKDWHGWLPRAAVVEFVPDPSTGVLSWMVTAEDEPGEDGFRPTVLMERVSRELEIAGEPLSRNELEKLVKGKRDYVRQAIDALVREDYAEEVRGSRGARQVGLLRPYREADE